MKATAWIMQPPRWMCGMGLGYGGCRLNFRGPVLITESDVLPGIHERLGLCMLYALTLAKCRHVNLIFKRT